MNLNTTPPTDFSSLNNFTNSTLASFQNTTFNQTAALLMAVNNSSYTWDMKYYWIIAVSLLCTIPLSIAAGEVFRWSIRFAARHVMYWRVIVILVGIIIVVLLFGDVPIISRLADSYYISAVLHSIVLGSYSVWRLLRAYRNKRGRRVWTGFLVVFLLTLSTLVYHYMLSLLLIPWVYLLLIWIGPDIKRGWRNMIRKRDSS